MSFDEKDIYEGKLKSIIMTSKKLSVLLLTIALFISPMVLCFIPTTQVMSDVIVLEPKQGQSGQGQYVVVPITVYQVEGSTITPQQVQDMLNRLNKLHNCEVVVYTWNGIILPLLPDPDGGHGSGPGGTGDIEYPSAGNDGEHNNLSSAVNGHPMNPTNPGIQIVICNQIVNGSGNSVAGGYAYSGQGPIVVSDHCATDPSWGGRAWAHEIGHFYGCDHNGNNESRPNNNGLVLYDSNGDGEVNASTGDVVGSDGNGDGFVTQADQNYNMYGGFPPGTDYTPTQHSQMFNSAKSIPGAEVRPLPSSGKPPIPPNIPVQISGNHSGKPKNQTGTPTETINHRNVDVRKFTLFRNLTSKNPVVKVTIDLNGSIMTNSFSKYGFIISNNRTFTLDNEYNITYTDGFLHLSNRTVGDPLFQEHPIQPGLTWEYELSSAFLTGDFNSTMELNETQMDEIINNTGFNDALLNSTLTITVNGSYVNEMFGDDVSDQADYQHNITVFAGAIDDDDVINDSITVFGAYLGNITNLPYLLTTYDHVLPGNIINISVYGFKPNSELNVTLNGEKILNTTTDGTGNATIAYTIPIKSTDHYVLSVIDEDNQTDSMYLHIEYTDSGNGNGTPPIPGFELLFLILGIGIACVFFTIQRKKVKENQLTF